MSDEELIGYLFDLLDPGDRAAVAARLEADPELAARLDRLRADAAPMLSVMEAEREESPEPPPGLALRAIEAVARHVVATEPRPAGDDTGEAAVAAFLREHAEPPRELEFDTGTRARGSPSAPRRQPRPAPPPDGPEFRSGGRLRADLLVAASIAFVGLALVVSGVAKARHDARVVACQNSMRTLYDGLSGYADTDPQRRYPQIGTPAHPTAETFAASLSDLGYLPAGYAPGCPAVPERPAYAYTLGFRGPDGQLLGLRRPTDGSAAEGEGALMPIAADYPSGSAAPADGPLSPHGRGMNVLFVGGNVRLTTSPHVGPRGDDIYRNFFGNVAAGASPADAVLGRAGDRP
jgi:prepilin-type processing-associated H-X9-DG protein